MLVGEQLRGERREVGEAAVHEEAREHGARSGTARSRSPRSRRSDRAGTAAGPLRPVNQPHILRRAATARTRRTIAGERAERHPDDSKAAFRSRLEDYFRNVGPTAPARNSDRRPEPRAARDDTLLRCERAAEADSGSRSRGGRERQSVPSDHQKVGDRLRASSGRPWAISQRGDSGKYHVMKRASSAGVSPNANSGRSRSGSARGADSQRGEQDADRGRSRW